MSVQTKILEGLNNRQEEAVKSISGETLVIAGAGSGKTAVLTRRCAHLITNGVVPGQILCLTFTNKAANEMKNRVNKLLAAAGFNLPHVPIWKTDYTSTPLLCTFHSLGVRLLREFGDKINIPSTFNILDTDDQQKIMRNLLKELNIDTKKTNPKGVLSFISKCKQEMLEPNQSRQLEYNYPDIYHSLYKKYETYLSVNQVVDFDDLIYKAYLLLSKNPDVVKILHNRWTHIMVDEFQDTNQAQFELIKLLYNVQ